MREVWLGDPGASDEAMQSEHSVARIRVLLIGAPTVLGLLIVLFDPQKVEFVQAVPVNLVCLLLAVVVLFATRHGQRPTWLAAATSIGDVSLVSLLLALDLMQGHPSIAVNGRVTFMGYFPALLGTCVRWDKRIPIATGVIAAAQYAGIVAAAVSMWPNTATADVVKYGQFDWGVQIERAGMLIVFGFACSRITLWALQLRDFATTDQLTGLMNRRTFESRVRDELLKAKRLGSSLSLVMVDLDHFKQVNDQHGHRAGDRVLQATATTLRQSVRRTDLVSRWGGEEFAIAYLDASPDEAARNAESLRAAVERADVVLESGQAVAVTLSAGVATATSDGFELDPLVAAADERLLKAKRSGRNQLVAT